jgi:hypothetical protein
LALQNYVLCSGLQRLVGVNCQPMKTVVFMKKFTCFLLLAVSMATISCKKEKTSNEKFALHVDLQYSFDNDKVQIFIDGKEVYNNIVSTNDLLGFAAGFSLEKESGLHTLSVKLNDNITDAKIFTLDKELYIGVSHGSVEGFRFRIQDTPFGYD